MIRWEEQDNGDWHGLSGDLVVARVAKGAGAGKTRWTWQMQGIERPPGWRISGHRASVLAARRAADESWSRWLKTAALKPDIERLAERSS